VIKVQLKDYVYINLPVKTGDLIVDVKNLLINNNKIKIFKHVEAVAKTNIYIAHKYNLDKKICELAGYLHDISCIMKPSDMLTYAMKNNLYIDESEIKYPFLLHQRISRIISETYFNIKDLNVLSSIECHTTLKENPNSFEMALFVADKLSWDQNESPPFYDLVNNALEISLEKASLSYMDYVVDNQMLLFPHKWFNDGKNYLYRTTIKIE